MRTSKIIPLLLVTDTFQAKTIFEGPRAARARRKARDNHRVLHLQGNLMRITSDQTIADYPAVRVRQLIRETARASITIQHVRQVLRCSDSGAASVLNRLEKEGLIESVSGRLEQS